MEKKGEYAYSKGSHDLLHTLNITSEKNNI